MLERGWTTHAQAALFAAYYKMTDASASAKLYTVVLGVTREYTKNTCHLDDAQRTKLLGEPLATKVSNTLDCD